jgi:error-prone DNA polymerase
VRDQLDQLHIRPTTSLQNMRDGESVKVAGLVLVRQRPGTATGICFITIEDETGTANLVVFQKLFDRDRKEIIQAKLLMVDGKVQREGEVIHVVVKRCYNITRLMRKLTPIEEPVFPEARNFK